MIRREKEIHSKRKFLGKWYNGITAYSQKKEAIEKKESLKKQGMSVRMVKTGDGLYAIYARKKK